MAGRGEKGGRRDHKGTHGSWKSHSQMIYCALTSYLHAKSRRLNASSWTAVASAVHQLESTRLIVPALHADQQVHTTSHRSHVCPSCISYRFHGRFISSSQSHVTVCFFVNGSIPAPSSYSSRRMILSTGPSNLLNPSLPKNATLTSVLATTLAARGLSSSKASSPK